MPEIIIKALTKKGKTAMSSEGKQSRMGAGALKLMGIKEMVVCDDPLTIRVSMKHVPGPVLEQMEIGLKMKFEKLGAEINEDYTLEVR